MSINERQVVGRRRPATIRDVAEVAGVSRAAVSKVIRNAYGVSPAMRSRVLAAIDQLNYRPRTAARAMRGSGFTIGFAIPQLGNDFFTQLINGAHEALVGTGYQLIVAPESSEAESTQTLEALSDRQVDGIIAVCPLVSTEWLERLATNVPIVLIGRHDSSVAYDTVTGDDDAGAQLVMDNLLELGHRRIAHLTGDFVVLRDEDTDPHALRLAAYLRRMRAAGFPAQDFRSGPAGAEAEAATAELLRTTPWPTAIFAGNDTLAIGALRAIGAAGAAGSVCVVGYDNIDLASHPQISLTTVDQYGVDMGRASAKLLLERIGGRQEAVHHQVDPVLRARSSTWQVEAGAEVARSTR